MLLSRRRFLVGSAAAGAIPRVLRRRYAGRSRRSGASLDPDDITKYGTPLLIPPVMPRSRTIPYPGGKPIDYYEISMRQLSQQILPAGLPATTVWGYGAVTSALAAGSYFTTPRR